MARTGAGLRGCSFLADQVAHPAHLYARDTTLAFVSRAQAEIQSLKERMGWQKIPWYTMTDDFDADFGVDEWHGTNAFIREGENVFRTYLINSRGDEAMGGTWATSTSPPSADRRSGRTRQRGTRRPRRTGGGTTTTPTAKKRDRVRPKSAIGDDDRVHAPRRRVGRYVPLTRDTRHRMSASPSARTAQSGM